MRLEFENELVFESLEDFRRADKMWKNTQENGIKKGKEKRMYMTYFRNKRQDSKNLNCKEIIYL